MMTASVPCRRQGCPYRAQSNKQHCCRLCSFNGKHGPACQKELTNVAALPPSSEANRITLISGGQRRHALLFGQNAGSKQPTIIALHGGGGNASSFQSHCGLNAVAQREGVIVAYPQGTSFGGFVASLFSHDLCAWNTGHILREAVEGVDDVGFLTALIETLVRDHNADPTRIYMTGLSNGGMMAHIYATRCSALIAAVAPICGAMFSTAERPELPVPVMMICGAKDEYVPMEGGISKAWHARNKQTTPMLPAGEALAFWVNVNNQPQDVPHINTSHGGVVTTTRFSAPAAETVLIVDANGSHEWPGGPHFNRRAAGAAVTGTFSFLAAEEVWNFFRDKQRG